MQPAFWFFSGQINVAPPSIIGHRIYRFGDELVLVSGYSNPKTRPEFVPDYPKICKIDNFFNRSFLRNDRIQGRI